MKSEGLRNAVVNLKAYALVDALVERSREEEDES